MFRRKSLRLVTLLAVLFFSVATTAYLAHVHGGKADHSERVTCELCSQMSGAAGAPSLPKAVSRPVQVFAFVSIERAQLSAVTPIVRAQRSRAPPISLVA
jgi:hypothetical protein